jgi:hypothetical protein
MDSRWQTLNLKKTRYLTCLKFQSAIMTVSDEEVEEIPVWFEPPDATRRRLYEARPEVACSRWKRANLGEIRGTLLCSFHMFHKFFDQETTQRQFLPWRKHTLIPKTWQCHERWRLAFPFASGWPAGGVHVLQALGFEEPEAVTARS